MTDASSWDYIVVGAGSAGCALVDQLSKADPKSRILVLEAGGSDRSLSIRFAASVLRAINEHNWGYESQPDPTRNNVVESWIRGRVLGGSSSINGMLYVRGAPEDYDRWNQLCGNKGGWSFTCPSSEHSAQIGA